MTDNTFPGRNSICPGKAVFRLKSHLWLVFVLILSWSWAVEHLGAETWNILVYMAADNNLAYNAVEDFNTMESVDLPPGVRVYLQTDLPEGHELEGGRRWRLRGDDSSQINSDQLANLGPINSADPASLSSFITWGLQQYQATRNMLVIWSHGDSWYKGDASKWICPDDGAQEAMSVSSGHLKSALAAHSGFDILLFDACSMQVIEVLTEVRGFARYVIGSQDLVPVRGFPYQDILPIMGGSLPDILAQIPVLYAASYDANGSQNPFNIGLPVTCSSLDMTLVEQFVDAWGDFSRNQREHAQELMQIRAGAYEMNTGLAEIDIGQFLGLISSQALDISLRNSAMELATLWDDAIISKVTVMHQDDIGSAAIWFPDIRLNFDNAWRFYRKLDFAGTGWLSLVNYAFGPDDTPPQQPQNLLLNKLPGGLILSFDAVPDPDSLYYTVLMEGDEADYDMSFYPGQSSGRISLSLPLRSKARLELRAIDQSGNQSQVAVLDFDFAGQNSPKLVVYPNPGRDLLMASWLLSEDPVEPISLQLYNLRGQLVWQKRVESEAAGTYFLGSEPLVRSLASGLYHLLIQSSRGRLRTRFVIL